MAPFAEDFNRFRLLLLQLDPTLNDIAPVEVAIVEEGPYRHVQARYVELLAYWRQSFELLRQHPAMGIGIVG